MTAKMDDARALAVDILDAYDHAVMALYSDEETGSNNNNCRAGYQRRTRRIRELILRRLAAPASHDAQRVGDEPIDANDGAEYIEHCADKLESFGQRITAGALRVIAEEHRALSTQQQATPKPEAAGALAGEAIGLRFGLGGLIVNTGTHEGESAVIIDVASQPGEIGAKAPDVPADTLAPVRLVFPTAEQAQRVSDALVNAPTANAELIERFRLAVSTMFKGEQDENGKRCHPRYGEDLETMAEVLAALSAATVAAQQPAVVGDGVPSIAAAKSMGAKGAPPNEGERLAFEAWMRGHCWALAAMWTGSEYVSDAEVGGRYSPDASRTRGLWAAWRDRAALTPAATPVPVGGEVPQRADYCEECWERISPDDDDQQGPVVEEAGEYKCAGCGAAIDSFDDDWECHCCGCITAERIRHRAALAHPPQDGRKGEEG